MEDKKKEAQTQVNGYMKYAGIGFQIAGTIAVGVFLGYWLDKHFQTKQPFFTLGFSLVFLIAGMYLGFRDFLKKD